MKHHVFKFSSIENFYYFLSLLGIWVVSELIFSFIFRVERSLIGASITTMIGYLIFFSWYLDPTHYQNIIIIVLAILWKSLFKKYSIHCINPLVLWIVLVYLLSLFGFLEFPYISWEWASRTINSIDIMLPISIRQIWTVSVL